MQKPLMTQIREILIDWSANDDEEEYCQFTSGDLFQAMQHTGITRKYLDCCIVRLNTRGEIIRMGSKDTGGVKRSFLFRVDRHTITHQMRDENEVHARQMAAGNRLEACMKAMRMAA
jgi:hypothetical protein